MCGACGEDGASRECGRGWRDRQGLDCEGWESYAQPKKSGVLFSWQRKAKSVFQIGELHDKKKKKDSGLNVDSELEGAR